MESINKLYNKIGGELFLLLPKGAESISYFIHIYNDSEEFTIKYSKDGCFRGLNFLDKEDIADNISILLKELNGQGIFKKEPWTQCRFNLTADGEFSIKFAYINEDNAWTGVYLKGISELSWEEADSYGIPKEYWQERVKRYGNNV